MADRRASPGGAIVLSADDFAMTEGVTRGIEELAAAGRISATTALVTSHHWSAHAPRLAALRDRVAAGVHLNLTLGAPLGAMAGLAPAGRLPVVADLIQAALKGEVDTDEVRAEFERQLAAFETATGHPPDLVDGHQHVHALPGVREALFAALAAHGYATPPLVRDPAPRIGATLLRRSGLAKALTIAWLARGFGAAARRAGFLVNDTFAGVTGFATDAVERDFMRAEIGAGPLHLVMCHPGHPDAELAALDPVTDRRGAELRFLLARDIYGARLWRPSRPADGPPIDWRLGAGVHDA